jgi:hypothetical protein
MRNFSGICWLRYEPVLLQIFDALKVVEYENLAQIMSYGTLFGKLAFRKFNKCHEFNLSPKKTRSESNLKLATLPSS